MKINRMDHVGITVSDIASATEFFLGLGFELVGEDVVEGDLVDRIIGLRGVRSKIAMLRMPDGGVNIELSEFLSPPSVDGSEGALVNARGIRHLCFDVTDLDGLLAKAKSKGATLVGEVVNYENMYKLCYIHGPDGILLEFAEKL